MKEENNLVDIADDSDELYGIGLKVDIETVGDQKKFIVRGFVEGCETKYSDCLQSGNVITKVDGKCVRDKSLAEVLFMVLGPCGTTVTLTVEKKHIEQSLIPAPFTFLPIHEQTLTCRYVFFKQGFPFWTSRSKLDEFRGIKVFGGGQLPKGFEHLEVLRTSVPYVSTTFSARNVVLPRKYKMPSSSLKLLKQLVGDIPEFHTRKRKQKSSSSSPVSSFKITHQIVQKDCRDVIELKPAKYLGECE